MWLCKTGRKLTHNKSWIDEEGYLIFENFFQTSMISRKKFIKAKTVFIEEGCLVAFIYIVYEYLPDNKMWKKSQRFLFHFLMYQILVKAK